MKQTTENTVTDNATPRPWHFVNYGFVEGMYEYEIKTQDWVRVCHLKAAESEELEANAALIVRSVNLHDELANTIQGIYNYSKLCKGTDAERIQYLAKQGLDKINACFIDAID